MNYTTLTLHIEIDGEHYETRTESADQVMHYLMMYRNGGAKVKLQATGVWTADLKGGDKVLLILS